jgi:AcrR family transcriptional regulator
VRVVAVDLVVDPARDEVDHPLPPDPLPPDPSSPDPLPTDPVPPLRRAAVSRSLATRQAGAEAEVAKLLQAAYRLISRDGTVEPRVRDLLAEAGLANRSFYRHFSTKDEFLLVLMEDLQARLAVFVEEGMAACDEPLDRVRAWVLCVLGQAADEQTATLGRPFLVHGARLREAYPSVYLASGTALIDSLERAIRAAVAAGQLHSRDPRADARATFHLALSVMQSHVLDRTIPSAEEQAAVLDFALRAMR